MRRRAALAALLACAGLGVGTPGSAQVADAAAVELPTRFPAAPRVVAIGDLHGDLGATRAALRLAGAIDDRDRWIGGELVLVQTGDQLDRGGDEPEILDLLDALREQARLAGGALHVLNGNHELMNARLDMRYVTVEGYLDFLEKPVADLAAATPQQVVDGVAARIRAMRPGGPVALRLARRNVVVIVGDTVFVHGGVLPHVAEYGLERLNEETRRWLRKEQDCPPPVLLPSDGPVWSRHYSDEVDAGDCGLLGVTLNRLGAKRMVVGHTVDKTGISTACEGKVWRIDVGLAKAYGGPLEVLEIRDGEARVLRPGPPQQR